MVSGRLTRRWRTRFFGLVGLLFFILLALGAGRHFWQFWHQGWQGRDRLALFLAGNDGGWLVVVDPQNKTGRGWYFPKNWLVTAVGQYGRFPLTGLGRLALEEKKSSLWRLSLMLELGLPLDLALYDNHPLNLVAETSANNHFSHRLAVWLWSHGVVGRTAVLAGQRRDCLKLFFFLQRHPLKWRLQTAMAVGLKKGRGVYQNDYQLSPSPWQDLGLAYFLSHQLRAEKVAVAVYNASHSPALAEKVAQVIGNRGGLVVKVADAHQGRSGCRWRLAGAFLLNSATFRQLSALFPCRYEIKKEKVFSDTSRLQLILGKDWFLFPPVGEAGE